MQKSQKAEEKQDNKDPFFGLKYIAYCRAFMPPSDAEIDSDDMLQYARFYLCQKRGVLYNAEIWDNYTEEEILVEYFAVRMSEDETLKAEFEAQMRGINKADHEWFDKMTEKYNKKLEEEAKEAAGGKDEFEDSFE